MMRFNLFKNTVLLLVFLFLSCGNGKKVEERSLKLEAGSGKMEDGSEILKQVQNDSEIIVAANQTENYLPLLKGKCVGVVANQTSIIEKQETRNKKQDALKFTHLIDSLVALGVDVKKVLAPEHGFRGKADAGELVKDGVDTKTGLPIVSLYGKNKKPYPEQLQDLDLVLFDIQDVGARFYTYIYTLHYVMEACAEANIPVVVLDRPNPNGHYIDGPILELEHASFVGMHPIPVVHGMTIGEYGQMTNGQGWLANKVKCDLTVIPIKNYNRNKSYSLPIKPSPNLPNDQSINLYPSLCFFEGTNVNAGRGTNTQFQVFGSPFLNTEFYEYSYTPKSMSGAKNPKNKDLLCYGKDLTKAKKLSGINLEWLIEAYNATEDKNKFFIPYFTELAGTKKLQQQIEQGYTFREIRKTWLKGLETFDKMRRQYLIYE